jgi:hypothetical protein
MGGLRKASAQAVMAGTIWPRGEGRSRAAVRVKDRCLAVIGQRAALAWARLVRLGDLVSWTRSSSPSLVARFLVERLDPSSEEGETHVHRGHAALSPSAHPEWLLVSAA